MISGPAVTASDPSQGEVVTTTPPTNFSLKFNEPIVPSSVDAGDFTVNGIPADWDILSPDDTTIFYSFTSSPVITQGAANDGASGGFRDRCQRWSG